MTFWEKSSGGKNFDHHSLIPSIAQSVERRTVEVKLSSLRRWFESGLKEFVLFFENFDFSGTGIKTALFKIFSFCVKTE